jgi:hypothetical protein
MSLWNLLSKRILENSPYRKKSQIRKMLSGGFWKQDADIFVGFWSFTLLINMQK